MSKPIWELSPCTTNPTDIATVDVASPTPFFNSCDGRRLDLLREVPLKWRVSTLILATRRGCGLLAVCQRI